MTKINLKEIQHRIVQPTIIHSKNKVNRLDLIKSGRIRRRKGDKQKIVHKSFDTLCVDYNTQAEINLISGLLRLRVYKNIKECVEYDIGEDTQFMILNSLDRLRLIVNLLSSGCDLLIDGCVEKATDENIKQLRSLLNKEESKIEQRKLETAKGVEKLMWLKYGQNRSPNPLEREKERQEARAVFETLKAAKLAKEGKK